MPFKFIHISPKVYYKSYKKANITLSDFIFSLKPATIIPQLERPSDAPFFMERTSVQKRQQFRLIRGNDEIEDPAVAVSRRVFCARREQGEKLIMDFLVRIGLLSEQIDNIDFDVRFVRDDFNKYREENVSHAAEERDDVKKRFVEDLSLEKVSGYCRLQLKRAITDIKALPYNADIETCNTVYFTRNYWCKVNDIISQGLLVPEGKLIPFYTQKIALEQPQNPQESEVVKKQGRTLHLQIE